MRGDQDQFKEIMMYVALGYFTIISYIVIIFAMLQTGEVQADYGLVFGVFSIGAIISLTASTLIIRKRMRNYEAIDEKIMVNNIVKLAVAHVPALLALAAVFIFFFG